MVIFIIITVQFLIPLRYRPQLGCVYLSRIRRLVMCRTQRDEVAAFEPHGEILRKRHYVMHLKVPAVVPPHLYAYLTYAHVTEYYALSCVLPRLRAAEMLLRLSVLVPFPHGLLRACVAPRMYPPAVFARLVHTITTYGR